LPTCALCCSLSSCSIIIIANSCIMLLIIEHLWRHCRLVANVHIPTPVGSCCSFEQRSERPELVSFMLLMVWSSCGVIANL
jgi:hypothetical protein